MVSAGSTATVPGSALIAAATAVHPGGYCTGLRVPATPQARPGSTAITATADTAAVTRGFTHRRSVTTAAAAANR